MNRTNLSIIVLVAFIGVAVVFQSTQNKKDEQTYRVGNTAIHIEVDRNSTRLIDATRRLAHHSKMIVLETLIITKRSVHLALDVAIESL